MACSKILIVDDHPVFRAGLKQIISELPEVTHVTEAASGEDALAVLRAEPADLVVLDLAMPGMDGLKLMELLRDQDPMPLVVVVTSYDDLAYLNRTFELGGRAFVLKDSAITDIAHCLNVVLRGGVYVSPTLGKAHVEPPGHAELEEQLELLTPTEKRVLAELASFLTSKEIARKLNMSYRTVQNHRANIGRKLGFRGAHQLLEFASRASAK